MCRPAAEVLPVADTVTPFECGESMPVEEAIKTGKAVGIVGVTTMLVVIFAATRSGAGHQAAR
jgi:predicted ABC-class ATPase